MIIVDYIQLMRGTLNYEEDVFKKYQRLLKIKVIAKELSVLVALSQLSRQAEQEIIKTNYLI